MANENVLTSISSIGNKPIKSWKIYSLNRNSSGHSDSIFIGTSNTANHYNSIVFGTSNYTPTVENDSHDDGYNVAIGLSNSAMRNYDFAFGLHTLASGGENIVIGAPQTEAPYNYNNDRYNYETKAIGYKNISIRSDITGINNIAYETVFPVFSTDYNKNKNMNNIFYRSMIVDNSEFCRLIGNDIIDSQLKLNKIEKETGSYTVSCIDTQGNYIRHSDVNYSTFTKNENDDDVFFNYNSITNTQYSNNNNLAITSRFFNNNILKYNDIFSADFISHSALQRSNAMIVTQNGTVSASDYKTSAGDSVAEIITLFKSLSAWASAQGWTI